MCKVRQVSCPLHITPIMKSAHCSILRQKSYLPHLTKRRRYFARKMAIKICDQARAAQSYAQGRRRLRGRPRHCSLGVILDVVLEVVLEVILEVILDVILKVIP